MKPPLLLANARHRLEVVPEAGGAIIRFDAVTAAGARPILVPRGPDADPDRFDFGLNLLAPFSNRISAGGFSFAKAFHRLAPNLPSEAFPIHGDALTAKWSVGKASASMIRLLHHAGSFGPFRYAAEVSYELADEGLRATLTLTNLGEPLPFGAGFHPWFPRLGVTSLAFQAAQMWEEDERHLPTRLVALQGDQDPGFADGASLPAGWINNAFVGWNGRATIGQPELGIAVSIEASPLLSTALVYSPNADADFFCFEPVSHPVDAHNMPGQPGLVVLENGASLSASLTLRWAPLP